MNWTLATNEQLKTIIKHDHYCPVNLINGVVEEMLNRNLFDGLIMFVINKRFISLPIACKKLVMSKEELLQEGRTEIWKSISKYKGGRSSFAYYVSLVLKSLYRDMETSFEFGRKKTLLHSQSIYTPIHEEITIADILPSGRNVEKEVLRKIEFAERLSMLEEGEKETFLLYLEGYSFTEISKMLDLSKSGINRRIKRALIKLTGKEINLKDLGINHYKLGA